MRKQLLALLLLTCLPLLSAYAHEDEDKNAPNLPDYIASKRLPPFSARFDNTFDYLRGFYVAIPVGVSFFRFTSIKPKDSPLMPTNRTLNDKQEQLGLILGYQVDVTGGIERFELEYTYRGPLKDYVTGFQGLPRNNILKGEVRNQTLMLNAFYDINFRIKLIPYLQAGIGAAYNRVHTVSTLPSLGFNSIQSKNKLRIAFNVGAGIRTKLSKHAYVAIAYQFYDLGRVNFLFQGPGAVTQNKLSTSNTFVQAVTVRFTWVPLPIEDASDCDTD